MGARYSILPDPKPFLDTDKDDAYFSIALLEPDRMCLLHATDDVISIIQRSIKGNRPCVAQDNPIQKEGKREDNSYEIQFRGHPFSKYGSRSTALRIKRVFCQMVADLYANGWDLCVASDLTTSDYHTTWFFRKNGLTGERTRSKTRIVSLSLSGSDSLTLVNAPDRLRKALIDAVRLGYIYGTEEEDVFGDDTIEIKLNGEPWETSMLEEGLWARKLLLEIFRQFSKCHYSYYAVADIKGTADSIFFIYQQMNEPGEGRMRNTMGNVEKNDIGETGMRTRGSPDRRRSSLISGLDKDTNKDASNLLTVTLSQPRRSSWQERSAPPPTIPTDPRPFQIEQFFMVSLNRTDSLRLIDASKAIRELTKRVIISHWPHCLQREIKYDMAYEYRLNRSPWSATGSDAVAVRSLLTVLFESLLRHGWRLLATLDISRRRNDKSVFLLKKDPTFKPPGPSQHHFCLSMTEGDKIRIVRGDARVIQLVKTVVSEKWPHGIQKEENFFGAHQIQLIGHPWINLPGKGNEPLAARVLMMEMLRAFHDQNWKVVVSADISGRYHTFTNLVYNPVSVDSWIVAKEEEQEFTDGMIKENQEFL